MKWANLKEVRCPKCSKKLYHANEVYACTDRNCGFSIREQRFNEVVNDIYKGSRHKSDEDRHAEWNNYGHEKPSDDFSDSPHL